MKNEQLNNPAETSDAKHRMLKARARRALNDQQANLLSLRLRMTRGFFGIIASTGASLFPVLLHAQPVITSVQPSVLTQRIGDHAAYVVSASGNGTLSYQWYQNGTALSGQTSSALVLTNIQAASAGQYGVTVTDDSHTSVSNYATLTVSADYLRLYPTNLIIARIGDGAQTLSGATGNTLYLDQYTVQGVYVSTVQIPDENPGSSTNGSSKSVYGSPSLLVAGGGNDVNYGAVLTTSGNQQFLNFAGYAQAYPFSGTDVSSSAGNGGAIWRGIYSINGLGFYTLAYTNTGLYSGGNHTIRSAASLDGATNFWTTGQAGSGGVKYADKTVASYARGAGIPTITSSGPGSRVVQIVNSNLVFSDWSGTGGSGLYVTAGIPQPAANSTSPSSLLVGEGGHPVDFAFSPDSQTVYIADDQEFAGSTFQAGGVQRWDADGFGGFSYSYTLPPTTGTSGALGLVVSFPTNITSWGVGITGAVIYVTSADSSPNSLSRIVDQGADSTPTVIVTAGTNQFLRGVRFGPAAVAPVFIVSQPQSQTNFIGNSATLSVSAGGAQPYFYQWQFNGTNLSGATLSSLVLTNVQAAAAGNYSVIVSNAVSSVSSSTGTLAVVLGPPALVTTPKSSVETVGDHLAFTVQAIGTLPISYQWSFNNSPIAGATNTSLVLTNIQTASSGNYSVSVSNVYGQTNALATLSVTASQQSLSSNNLVIARVGDGAQPLSYATGNTLYLDQIQTDGNYVNSIQIPDVLPSALVVSGGATDGIHGSVLTLSQNKAYLNFSGFNVAQPYTGSGNGIGAANVTYRAIGAVSAFGYYSLALTNKGLYSGGNEIRSAVSSDGLKNFWTTGVASSAGVKYVSDAYANGNGIPALSGSLNGTRSVDIDPYGNVVFTDAGAGFTGLNTFYGAPLQAPNPSTLTINVGPSGSPNDFAISPDVQTVYIADDNNFSGTNGVGGIERWDNAGGVWVLSYTLGTGSQAGARGLTVDFSASSSWGPGVSGAVLYATTAESSDNRLIRIVDTGAASPAKVLRVAGPNQILRGVRFGPVPVPVSITTDLQEQSVTAGQSVTFNVGITGSGPFTYQWQLNGTNIAGATQASFTIANVHAVDSGVYSVVVSNPISTISSSAVTLTVTPAPVFSSSTYLGLGQGFKLNFSGPAGVAYTLWTSSDPNLRPVQSTWTPLTSGSTFSGGADSFIDTSGGNGTNQFYIITIP